MTPIPQEAMPVVEILRRDVPRPELPLLDPSDGEPYWFRRGETCCAMGLHPDATQRWPIGINGFPLGPTWGEIEAFADWHDAQRNPQELVDAIWPKAREGEGE